MDDVALGLLVRSIRRRRGLRQVDVADRARVSQQLVSVFERGGLERLTVSSARSMARALGVTLPIEPRWTAGNIAAVLDEEHSQIVEAVARRLRDGGWEVLVEFTFSHYGERGSIDLVGWQPGTAGLLVVEVKSRIVDV